LVPALDTNESRAGQGSAGSEPLTEPTRNPVEVRQVCQRLWKIVEDGNSLWPPSSGHTFVMTARFCSGMTLRATCRTPQSMPSNSRPTASQARKSASGSMVKEGRGRRRSRWWIPELPEARRILSTWWRNSSMSRRLSRAGIGSSCRRYSRRRFRLCRQQNLRGTAVTVGSNPDHLISVAERRELPFAGEYVYHSSGLRFRLLSH